MGSLIYELRADKQQLMVLDYHNEWFVLKANDADARREWLGWTFHWKNWAGCFRESVNALPEVGPLFQTALRA